VIAAFHLLLACACGDLPVLEYQTERLLIGKSFDEPICEGTLEALDDHVEGVERALGRPKIVDPIVVYWLDDVEKECGKGRGGCFYPGTRVLFSTGASITHELVHAVLDSTAHTYFVEEGMAEIYSGVDAYYRPDPADGALADRLEISRSAYRDGKLDYASAAHFMRYVHESQGEVAMRDIASVIADGGSTGKITTAIEQAFGASIDEIEAEYFEEAPSYFRGFAAEEVPRIDGLAEVHEVHLECDDDGTRGPLGLRDGGGGMYKVRRVSVKRGGTAQFAVTGDDGGWVTLFDPSASRGIVTNWAAPDSTIDENATTLRAGESADVELDPGTYLMVFGADSDDTDVGATLTMALPPPVGGEGVPEAG
jgi:hypothetical protein